MKRKLTTALLTLTVMSAPAWATTHHPGQHDAGAPAQNQPAAEGAISVGEVRKIDKEAGKITLKHGELKNLQMPPMTMVFRVKDPAMLEQVKVGDKVNFVAEKVGGQFTVARIEPKQ